MSQTTIFSSCGDHLLAPADAVARLVGRLETRTLDPRYEPHGGFATDDPRQPGTTLFWGRFVDDPHVFRVESSAPDVVTPLRAAILLHLDTDRYRAAREAWAARCAAARQVLADRETGPDGRRRNDPADYLAPADPRT